MTESAYFLPDPDSQPEFYADTPVKRLIAWGIDSVLIMIASVLIIPFTAFTGLFFFPLLYLVVGFAYRVVTLANGSATLGMRLTSIEFRNQHGQRFDLGHAFMHTFGYSLSLALPLLQVVSIVLMLTTSRGQGLTDHVMGTVALNRAARY